MHEMSITIDGKNFLVTLVGRDICSLYDADTGEDLSDNEDMVSSINEYLNEIEDIAPFDEEEVFVNRTDTKQCSVMESFPTLGGHEYDRYMRK